MRDWAEQEAWRQGHGDQIERTMPLVWVLWLACLSEPVVLAVIVFGFGDRIRQSVALEDPLPLTLIRAILIGFATLSLIGSALLRRILLRPRQSGPEAMGSAPPLCSVLYRSRVMAPSALAASPAVFGFVLFFLGDSIMVFAGLALAALLGLIWHRPSTDEFVMFAMQFEQERTDGSMA
jgi:hypothetical protein